LEGRWYVGGGAAFHQYYTINRPHSQVRPVYVAGGYYLKPRLALQAELQYGQRTEKRNGGESVIDGETVSIRSKEKTTSTALTLLARFSRSRPQRPLQFDWLLGVAWVHGQSSETITRTSATSQEDFHYTPVSSTSPHLVGGISLRYQLGPKVALSTEVVVNKNLQIPPFTVWGFTLGRGATLGLTYLFEPAKP
jgi:hypothetical protein